MNLKEQRVKDIFDLSHIYNIPSYQREYKWESLEVQTLIDDFLNFFEKYQEKGNFNIKYFLGIIIVQKPKKNFSNEKYDFDLIDGQQRMTTLFLLMKVIIDLRNDYKKYEENELDENIEILKNQDYEVNFMHDRNRKKNYKFKLKNRNKDLKEFIFENNSEHHNIKQAYDILHNNIENKFPDSESIELFYESLQNIILGVLEVSTEENAEELFENINSKNKTLTISELIKNKLLLINNSLFKEKYSKDNLVMSNDKHYIFEEKILKLFKEIEYIQDRISRKNSKFNFLNIKNNEDIVRAIMSNVLKIFIENGDEAYKKNIKKSLEEKLDKNIETFEKFLNRIEKIFNAFEILNKIILKKTEASLYLNWISQKSTSFLIHLPNDFLNFLEKNNIQIDNFENIDEKITIYIKNIFINIAKASIASSGFSGINMWKSLVKTINGDNLINWSATLEKVISKGFYYENDIDNNSNSLNDFAELILDKSFYKDNAKLAKLFLILIEKKLSKYNISWESINNYYQSSRLNVNQIIPKKIDYSSSVGQDWIKMLGNVNYNLLVDTIGNLFLLNSKIKNKTYFSIQNEVKKEKFLVNDIFLQHSNFTIEILNKRSEYLRSIILEILGE